MQQVGLNGSVATQRRAPLGVELYLCRLPLSTGRQVRKALACSRNVKHRTSAKGTIVAAFALVAVAGCRPQEGPATVAEVKAEASTDGTAIDADRTRTRRATALASAQVWHEPHVPIREADLRNNPAGSFLATDEVACRFSLAPVSGTTPKFYCELPGGERLKIKYGAGNPELHAEVAATRLLAALGFGADQMFVVRKVRCAGCPTFPFQSLRCLDRTGFKAACFPGGIDESQVVDFEVAVVERKRPGRVIETVEDQGWAWFELDRIDQAHGGASRAEVDAFRLMAVFLAHWDNKAANQRLICPPEFDRDDGTCVQPLAIMQDLGATFGPMKIDLHNWRQGQIWKDGATCTVSMAHLPWGGATFPERKISEEGRLMLLGLLEQLSDQQLRDLFEGSRVTSHDQFSAEARRADAWVRVFRDKVRQIREGGPCPK
jgi:hypothetical protein